MFASVVFYSWSVEFCVEFTSSVEFRVKLPSVELAVEFNSVAVRLLEAVTF